MSTRRGLIPVVLGTALVAAAYGSAFLPGGAPAWGTWSMVLGIALVSAGTMALGAARPGRPLGGLAWAFVFVFVVVAGCFGAALLLPANEHAGSTLLLGLPVRAALVLYGIGWLPAFVLPVVYARTFRSQTLDAADLERIRAARPASPGP